MKPIIVDMKEMSESVEVYKSKPNPFMVYTIYTVFAIVVVACIWMCFFDINDVVKSSGIFKSAEDIYDVGSAVTGVVKEKYVNDGDYVKEGDVLYVVEIESLSDTIVLYQKNLKNTEDRLEVLDAYAESLDGDTELLDELADNQYYWEFKNKQNLLFENIEKNSEDVNDKIELYDNSIQSITDTIQKYNTKIDKFNEVKTCIICKNNTIDKSESYYYSIVSNYLSSYNLTDMQYNSKIEEYKNKINELDNVMKQDNASDLDALNKSKEEYYSYMAATETEKTQALANLENQKLLELEQMIEEINSSIITLNSNLETAKLERTSISDNSNTTNKNIAILTEKGNIASERISLKEKKEEYESYLNKYNIQNKNCNVMAVSSGYYYDDQNLKQGSYVQEGTTIGKIYPEKESEFYAEVYVKNSDIGRIKEGQSVNLEIAAYPSMEYGYLKGEIVNISKDITVDESTGYAYYVVKVKCNNMTVKNKNGDMGNLKNGMACQAKIIIGEKSVMTYVLEKINLLD